MGMHNSYKELRCDHGEAELLKKGGMVWFAVRCGPKIGSIYKIVRNLGCPQ